MWEVAKSCVTLYKKGQTCASPGAGTSPCCTTADKEIFGNVWSLTLPDSAAPDYLLTNSVEERDILVAKGWRENCHAIGGPTVFCVDTALKDGTAGPFMLYNTSEVGLPTKALYRCLHSGTRHFFSTDRSCEG